MSTRIAMIVTTSMSMMSRGMEASRTSIRIDISRKNMLILITPIFTIATNIDMWAAPPKPGARKARQGAGPLHMGRGAVE